MLGSTCQTGKPSPRWLATLALAFAFLMLFPSPAEAYIGPGAGIAFVSSFFVILASLALALLTLLTWPFRWVLQTLRGRKALRGSRVRKVVILGLDGQDPELTDRFMADGSLPNFERLAGEGAYRRLATSLPAESPVAWSSFQTGCNPGYHKVFDFLVPDRRSYLPKLCSAEISPPARSLNIGKYRIPVGKPRIQFERRSRSFWKILGDHGVFSTVLRVPTSFPPEKFNGLLLSAMSVPDLKGTLGTFTFYTSDPTENGSFTGGTQIPVEIEAGQVRSYVPGPENPLRRDSTEMRIAFELNLDQETGEAILAIQGKQYPVPLAEFTPWIPLKFKAGLGMKISGMCRFYLRESAPHLKLYASPVNLDPERPAMPISHPPTYSIYLSKTQGRFATLGLAEDTWALNEGVLDEEAFLKQAYLIHEERERMFFDAIEKTNRGAVVCVFDITDRLQHMFWRYLVKDHPANLGRETLKHRDEIKKLYQKMDELVGRVLESVSDDTLVMVLSDHGFKSFQRGVNLNSWLHQNGYLTVHDGPAGAEWFQGVDWSRTQAYAVGLGGIYLNLAGRESQGIVAPGDEAREVKEGIIEGLEALRDGNRESQVVRRVHDTAEVYRGPYAAEGPDLITGFCPGYRSSWSSATGAVTTGVFEDNTRNWSGDHCMNPDDVPGVLFCNRKMTHGEASIMDIGPTVLDLFGVGVPAYCDGKPLGIEI